MERSDSFDDLTKSIIELCDDEPDYADGETLVVEPMATDTNNHLFSPMADKSISLSPIKKLWNSDVASSQKCSCSCSNPLLNCDLKFTRWPQRSGSDANNGGIINQSILSNKSTTLLSNVLKGTRKRKYKDDIESRAVNKKVNATYMIKHDCISKSRKQSNEDLLDGVSVLCDDHTMITLDACSNKAAESTQTCSGSTCTEGETDDMNRTLVALDVCHGDNSYSLPCTQSNMKEVKGESVNIIGHISTINIDDVLFSKKDPSSKCIVDVEMNPNKTEGRFKGLNSTRLMSITKASDDEDLSDNDDILGLDELTYMDDSSDSEIDDTILYENVANDTVVNVVEKEYMSVLLENLGGNRFSDPSSILNDEDWMDLRSKMPESNPGTICKQGQTTTIDQECMLLKNKNAYELKCEIDVTEKTVYKYDDPSVIPIETKSEVDITVNNKKYDNELDAKSNILKHAKSIIDICDDAKDADIKKSNISVGRKDSKLQVDVKKDLISENITSPIVTIVEPYICNKDMMRNSPKLTQVVKLTPRPLSTFKEDNNSRTLTFTLASPTSHNSAVEPVSATVKKPKFYPGVSRNKSGRNLHTPLMKSRGPTAKRKCFQNENNLMQDVMKKWKCSGIQSQDINLTCELSYRTKHGNAPGLLENDHISLLLDRRHGKPETMTDTSDNEINSFAGVFLDELRSEFKIHLQKSQDAVQNIKNECMNQRYEQEQINRECINDLLLLQNFELRDFQVEESHLYRYNPSFAQYRAIQLTYEHHRQMAVVQHDSFNNIHSIESYYNELIDKESEKIHEDKMRLQAIIQQLDSDEGCQKFDKLGPPISVKLSKAPHKGNPKKSIVTVCLPAKVASAIMNEDDLFDIYYKY